MALTDVAIKKAKPTGKTIRVFDAGGLYVEVSPAGSKLWRWKFRFAGKEKRLALGVYPDVSLADARERRDEARKLLAQGVDPSAQRRAERAARVEGAGNTFEVVAREWWEKQAPTWAETHSGRVLARLERDVFPFIGKRPVVDLTPPEVLRVLRRIESRGKIETAHRARTNISMVMRYAIATGRADRDPTGDLRGALKPVDPGHMAAVTDPEKLGPILRAIWGYAAEGTPVVASALKLGPYVFVRPGELRTAKWADIDLDTAEWRFVATKTKTPHIVPLAPQAVAILKDLQPLTGRSPYVFPSARANDRPMSDAAVNAALRRLGIDGEVMSGHGWRATARTLLDEVLHFPLDAIEHQLAHKVRDALGTSYNRTTHLPQRREMMQAWATYLDKLRADVRVLPFPAREAETG